MKCSFLQFLIILVLSDFCLTQISNPLENPHICGHPICKGPGKFKYGPGNQQDYKYSVEVTSLFNGTSKNESNLYVEGTVTFNFLSPCDGILSLSELKLSDSIPKENSEIIEHPNSQDFAEALGEFTLRFSFKDGIIDELCPHEDEQNWTLNFKRGILSLLHNTMKRFDLDYENEEEVDVRGKCSTNYNIIGVKDTSLLIEKTKDLKSCQGNSRLHSIIQSTPFSFEPKHKDNIIKSSSKCKLSIDHNIYNSVECEESHLLQPFSNENSGALTTLKQKLQLLHEDKVTISDEDDIYRRTPLIFDHIKSIKPTNSELKESRDLIKRLCSQSKNDLEIEFSDIFSKLIHTLRILSYPALSVLHRHSGTACMNGKKHFLDALPYIKTSASVTLMKDIILKNGVPEDTVNEWIVSMAFIPRPDKDTIAAVATLFNKKPFQANIALGVSSLAHTYCKQNRKCSENEDVTSIVNTLENHVNEFYSQKSFDRTAKDNLIVTLKALGNVGTISDDFENTLFTIIEDSNVDVAVRVAGAEVFRRLSCEGTRDYFERLFANRNEDVEVRIASYLQIMKCPNYLLIRSIKNALEKEEVNQVGSFVWSHLKNIIKTAVPYKVAVQSLLTEKDLVKKFSTDIRKFSHNREGSIYFEEYDLGANYESNIIFSPSSYIPKTGVFNLTVDLFGESVNLFELYGRMDGFEHYFESLFGPKGTSKDFIKDKIPKMRWTRGIQDNEVLKTEVEKFPNVVDDGIKEPKISLGLKVFGNDIKYSTFKGNDEIFAALKTLSPIDNLKRILSGREINYNKAFMFLDSDYVIPSGAGLPISLKAVGTAAVNVKLHGTLNTIQTKTREIDLTADIQPTVSVDVTGQMAVDAFFTNTGIKLKTSMYTASAIIADFKVSGTKLVSLKFSLPRRKTEIFGASSELLVRQNGVDIPQRNIFKDRVSQSMCSWNAVEQTVGLKLCAEYNFVNVTQNGPSFLFAGPAGFRVFINKSDPTANIYLFEYKHKKMNKLSEITLTFDTPNSTIHQLLNFNLTMDRQTQNLTMILQSSAGRVLANGRIKNTENEKYAEFNLDINNKKHFDASVSLVRHRIKNGYNYIPNVYLGVNGESIVELRGSVEVISKKDITQYALDLKFQTKRLTSKVFGYILKSDASLAVDLNWDYKFQRSKEQRVSLGFYIANRSRKNLNIITGSCKLNTTAYQNFNFETNVTFTKSVGHIDLNVLLKQNPLPEDHPDAQKLTLTFEWLTSYKFFVDSKRTFETGVRIQRPSSNLNITSKFNYQTIGSDINVLFFVKYGNNKEIAITGFWSHPRTTLEQIKAYLNVTVPSFVPMLVKIEVQEQMNDDWKVDFRGTWFSGHSVQALGLYRDKSKALTSNHHITVYLKSPNFKDIKLDMEYYRDNDIFKIDLKATYDKNTSYELYFNHAKLSEVNIKTDARIKYENKLYTFNSLLYNKEDDKKITVEIRFDQFRDIHFSVWLTNFETNKVAGVEIKWDANRDPNQKLLISANYIKVSPSNDVADIIIGYPGRTIMGKYRFLYETGLLETLASVSWDDDKTLGIDVSLKYDYNNKIYIELASRINTPFLEWHVTNINAKINHKMNMYNVNGGVTWGNKQKVSLDLFGDYSSKAGTFSCDYSCQLISTLDYIPNWTGSLKHAQNDSNYDTNIYIEHNPSFIIAANSTWNTISDNYFTNLTGTVLLTTPFNGFNKGILVSKIYLTKDKYLRGVADFDLNHKKYTTNIEAKYKKLRDSMLTINTTTPNGNYDIRYLLSLDRKHFIALVTHPHGAVGTEVLYQVNSLSDFNVKFYLASPLEFLKHVILIAKLQSENAEFRAGWNSLQAGFSGVWHYRNIRDFEYAYKIYTPIEYFEENGVVGKLKLKEGLDFEVSIRLSVYKLGVKLVGFPKPKTLKEFGIEIKEIYKKQAKSHSNIDLDNEDPLSWKGLIELDAVIYPTMKGELEIDQKGPFYVLQGKLLLPHGVATIFNELEYYRILFLNNNFKLTTPYKSFKSCSSEFNFNVEPGRNYLFNLNFDYQNNTKLIKSGIFAKFAMNIKEKVYSAYNVTLNVHTPLKLYERLDFSGVFESQENFYHTNVLFNTNRVNVSLEGTAEKEDQLLTVNSNLFVITPQFYLPHTYVNIKKEFTNTNNEIETLISIPEKLKKDIYCKMSWLIQSRNVFRALLEAETPIKGSENLTVGFNVDLSKEKSTVWITVQLQPIQIEVKSNYSNNLLDVISDLNLKGNRFPVKIHCKLVETSTKARDLDGTLTFKDKVFKIGGTISLPERAKVILSYDSLKVSPIEFDYQIQSAVDGYKLDGSIRYTEKVTKFKAQAVSLDKVNWDVNLQVLPPNNKEILIISTFKNGATRKDIYVTAKTPLIKLENCTFGGSLIKQGIQTETEGYVKLPGAKGNFNLNVAWLFLENMRVDFYGEYENNEYTSESSALLFYVNPKKTFQYLQVGGDVKIHRLLETASNITINLPSTSNISAEGHLKLPSNPKEVHSLNAKLNYADSLHFIDYLGNYRTSFTNKRYGSDGQINIKNKNDMIGNIGVEWNGNRYINYANVKQSNETFDVKYKLKTPKYSDKQHIVSNINYKKLKDSHNLTCQLFYPETQSVGYFTIDYKEIANMNGMFNVTVPYKNLHYLGAFFNTKTNAFVYDRYVKVFWHNNTAIVDGKCNTKTGETLLHRTTTGNLIIELPLATRHIANIDYNYEQKPQISQGYAIVTYNDSKTLEGKYNCVSESKAGFEKDTIDIELQNKKFPLGVKYVRSHEFGTPDAPVVNTKYVNLYNLANRTKFNVTGEVSVKTTTSGQELMLSATHSNRTVRLWTDYDVLDQEYKQHSRIELSPTVYIEYNVNLINKTIDDIFDIQQAQINISYPRRNFTIDGYYNISDSEIASDLVLIWGKDRKTIEAGLEWKKAALRREQLQFLIKHPSFERDITFFSEYGYNEKSIDGKLVVNYSLNPDQRLTLSGIIRDESNVTNLNYTYLIRGEHNATNLNLDTKGNFYWNNFNGYGTEHYTQYRRSYLPNIRDVTIGRINLRNNEIELKRDRISGLSYLWAKYDGKYPIYTANLTAIHGINDTSGEFYMNLRKKLLYLNYNMTKDASQSLHMHGIIPDARNAMFNIWRNYEERQIVDLSYFIRLNHSRLIVSKLKWRPDLISDFKGTVRGTIEHLYLEFLDNINTTKQYIRSETVEAMHGILQDAKPLTERFVADFRNLTVIEEDFGYLKKFVNKSYHANEFYIKDITTIILTLLDDSALKAQLQSLPKIVQEIWDVMGESGAKIKKNLLWVVEKLKLYYNTATEFIHSLINGDPVEHLSGLFKHLLEKYDDFIKNVHVAFIQYVEKLWSKAYNMLNDNWHRTLAALEPTFLKFVHYVETIFYNVTKKFLDFLYIKKNELIESPYFAKFTNFTQDLDKFYKDIKGSNTIYSIYKYSKIAWNFLKEKYLDSIPFGKELQEIIYEIYEELSQLKNISSIKYLISKYNEGYNFVKYYYDYFKIDQKLGKFFSLIYLKISDISATALDIESRNREAKTKFIFETADGIMLLEQKLPMSWHAFNETPQFQEIPEIKALYDLQNIFESSRISFWDLYYDYKPYTDPAEWLPPFKSQAMLIGSKYFITFDKQFYNYKGQCTYLLARDFQDANFTLLVSYESDGQTNELILLINNTVVNINPYKNYVHISNGETDHLPAEIGETYLYREADIVTVQSALGFTLECNMKYHMCTFEMSGWYFGKTAGLWGTLNNEPSDDLLTSAKVKANISTIDLFADSWTLGSSCTSTVPNNVNAISRPSSEITDLCNEFFTSKVSQLATCFPRIATDPYLSMCLNSTSEEEVCTSAIAYINMCSYANTPLRIPDTCVKCKLPNGTLVEEGAVIRLHGNSLPQTADIVFIVEAKQCNKNLKNNKNVETLLEQLDIELQESNITDNRYAVIVFGGNGVYDEPRSIVHNGAIFTDYKSILRYFDNIPIGDGNNDIFNALTYANKLHFRPGVSRNLILLPCTDCIESSMEHDYPVIHQLLFENSASLHILMNEHFTLEKEREIKTVFGVDIGSAYSKKDIRKLSGDVGLRKITNLPKSTLGTCTSLALESNGSIFSAKFLEADKKNVKKFATVFGKRLANSATPNACVECECTAPNTGVSYMECYHCTSSPTRTNFDRNYDDEDLFSF